MNIKINPFNKTNSCHILVKDDKNKTNKKNIYSHKQLFYDPSTHINHPLNIEHLKDLTYLRYFTF